jgi:hypothetical protein
MHGPSSRRTVLALEALEDRSVPTAGGLLSILGPMADASTHPGALLSGPAPLSTPTAVTALTTANGLNLRLDQSVDVPLIHADNVQVNVGLLPAAADQALLSLGVGGDVGVGPANGVAPAVSLGLGGPALLSADVRTPPSSALLPGLALSQTLPGDGPFEEAGSAVGAVLAAAKSAVGATTSMVRLAPVVADLGAAGAMSPEATLLAGAMQPATDGRVQAGADGGGGDVTDAGAPAAVLSARSQVADDSASDPSPPPPPLAAPGAGRAADATLNPEGAGLAMRFQPFGPAGLQPALADLAARVATPGGWLTWLLVRLRQAAPWLAALAAAGVLYEIRRRRAARRAAAAE